MSNTPSAHTGTEHTQWPSAVTPYRVLKRGGGVRVWAVGSPPQRSPTGYCLQRPCLFASGQPRSISLGAGGAMPPPGQQRLRRPRPSPSLWAGGGGQRKTLLLWPRCRRAALESETSKREPRWSSLYLFRLFGSPFPKLLAKSVSASRIFCPKAKALAELSLEPPFPGSQCSKRHYFPSCPKELVSLKCVPQWREPSGPAARRCGGSGGDRVPTARRAGPQVCLPSLASLPLSPGGSGGFRAVPDAPHRFDGG